MFHHIYLQTADLIMSKSYRDIVNEIEEYGSTLVAVSKTKPTEMIKELYDQGQRIFGENRVQELIEKASTLYDDIEWHMIGHLQTKKVKSVIPYVKMIHSVDTLKLAVEINKHSALNNLVTDVLLQIKIAEEDSKYGIDIKQLDGFVKDLNSENLDHIRICGVMGMATFTSDEQQIRMEFRKLKQVFDHLKTRCFKNEPTFTHISMGMSGDYQIALEEGSTMVRIGSLLFGARDFI